MAIRNFDRTLGSYISCGGPTSAFSGAHTLLVVAKPFNDGGFYGVYLSLQRDTDYNVASLRQDGSAPGVIGYYTELGVVAVDVGVTENEWQLLAVTKGSGTVAPRFHRGKLGASVMTHTSAGVTVPPITDTVTQIQLGATRNGAFGSHKNMRCAAAAVFQVALSDADLNGIFSQLASGAIDALNPYASYDLNQTTPTIGLGDRSGNSHNEFFKIDTTVVTDDDPLWAFGSFAAPSNTLLPSITGTPVTLQTLTCLSGTWSGSPIPALTYQWKRSTDGGTTWSNISGAVSANYQVQVADETYKLKCTVTATNNFGNASADSNVVNALAPPPVDIEMRLSGGASNNDPLTSVGGTLSSAQAPASLWDSITRVEANAGESEYRLVYIYNNDVVPANVKVWIPTQPTPATMQIGNSTQAKNVTVTAVANENTAPAGVTFSNPASSGAALNVADLNPGEFKGLWIKRTVAALTAGLIQAPWTLRMEVTPL
jgi:hypothetical protein